MDYLIRVENLEKRYDGFALAGVGLAVEPGCVVGFIGSNGAGKTTTIKAILGLIAPDGGTVELLGAPVAGPGARGGAAALDAVKARIGVVLDSCAFPAACRVREVASIGRAAYPTWDDARWDELLGAFGLAPRKKVGELSRGMGMKLTLAFALAHRPELLILDEATAGLDPMARDEVLDILRDFMADGEHGILMSTHITSDLEKIADEIVCVDVGRVVFAAPKDVIADEAGVARCRAADLDAVLASGLAELGGAPGAGAGGAGASLRGARVERHGYGVDVLVPDRFAFSRAFPDIPVDKASIEDYMTLILKGESR